MATKNTLPYKATHPGEILKDELDAREIKQKDFAKEIGMPVTALNELIKGKRSITADTAILLEASLGIDAKFWLDLQNQYDLDSASIQQKNIERIKDIELWKIIKENVPVKYFEKLGLLTNSLSKNIERIWDIYQCRDINDLLHYVATQKAYFKKSEKLCNNAVNIGGWCQLVRYKAKDICLQNPFDLSKKDELVRDLKTAYLNGKNLESQTLNSLNKYGIKFIILSKPEQAPIDGYSFLSDNIPVIAVTLRKATIDNFIFSIFHEIYHVYNHLYTEGNNGELNIEDEVSIKENEANVFAKDILIPKDEWSKFKRENICINHAIFDKKLIEFANKVGIHPSVVLGRYCYETSQYKIRSRISRKIDY